MCACHESPTETCAAEKSADKNAAAPPLDNPPSVSAEGEFRAVAQERTPGAAGASKAAGTRVSGSCEGRP